MITEPLSSFGVAVRFDEGCPVLHLTGEIDVSTAPELDALLGAILDRSHENVVLDLVGLRFMDGRGLSVIARCASRLGSVGGTVTVRAPDRMTEWLLARANLGDAVRVEPRRREARDTGSVAQTMQTLADQEVVRTALRLVITLAEATIDGADAVTLSLAPHGTLRDVVALDPAIARLDRDQYDVGEGPCLDAAARSDQYHIPSTADEQRWPAFVPLARARGVNSILSTPVKLAEGTAGALNMYSFRAHAFGDSQFDVAGLLASGAADVLDRSGSDVAKAREAARVQAALSHRRTIALAQGVLVGQRGITADTAYTALRQESQQTSQPLRYIAAAVVATAESGAVR